MSTDAPVHALDSLVLVRSRHAPLDLEDVTAQPVLARIAVLPAEVLDGAAEVERVERAAVGEPHHSVGDPQLASRRAAVGAELERAYLAPAAVRREAGDAVEAARGTGERVVQPSLDAPAAGQLSGHGAAAARRPERR